MKLADMLLSRGKNFIFIGEAGSGKSELAINAALMLRASGVEKLHFFDMDQTKPLLRARDAVDELRRAGVVFHCQEQYLDAPVVASGVTEALRDEDAVVFLDVGGGSHGSHMIGQFSAQLSGSGTEVLYLLNPYRPWSGCIGDIGETARRVLGAAGLTKYSLVANPNLGPSTTEEEFLRGLEKIHGLLPGEEPLFAGALAPLAEKLVAKTDIPILPMKLYIPPDWLYENSEGEIING